MAAITQTATTQSIAPVSARPNARPVDRGRAAPGGGMGGMGGMGALAAWAGRVEGSVSMSAGCVPTSAGCVLTSAGSAATPIGSSSHSPRAMSAS